MPRIRHSCAPCSKPRAATARRRFEVIAISAVSTVVEPTSCELVQPAGTAVADVDERHLRGQAAQRDDRVTRRVGRPRAVNAPAAGRRQAHRAAPSITLGAVLTSRTRMSVSPLNGPVSAPRLIVTQQSNTPDSVRSLPVFCDLSRGLHARRLARHLRVVGREVQLSARAATPTARAADRVGARRRPCPPTGCRRRDSRERSAG